MSTPNKKQRVPYAVGQQVPYAVPYTVGLGNDLWAHAMSFLDMKSHLTFGRTSRRMNDVSKTKGAWAGAAVEFREPETKWPRDPERFICQWRRIARLDVNLHRNAQLSACMSKAAFPELRKLDLAYLSSWSPSDWLLDKPHLEKFRLFGVHDVKVNGFDWAQLGEKLPRLTDLTVDWCRLDALEPTIQMIASLPPLTKLSMDWCFVHADVTQLCHTLSRKSANLQKLEFVSEALTDRDLRQLLPACTSLTDLDLSYGKYGFLSEDALRTVIQVKTLRTLRLGCCRLLKSRHGVGRARNWNPVLRILSQAHALTRLDLADTECDLRDDRTNFALLGPVVTKNLTSLSIEARCLGPRVVNSIFTHLSKLVELDLSNVSLTDEAIHVWPSPACSSTLTRLDLTNNPDLSNGAIQRLVKQLPKLQTLDMWSYDCHLRTTVMSGTADTA